MIWETIRQAVQAIFRNALRSTLTVLGIVIGVAAVIAMVTVGQASSDQVTEDVETGHKCIDGHAGGWAHGPW